MLRFPSISPLWCSWRTVADAFPVVLGLAATVTPGLASLSQELPTSPSERSIAGFPPKVSLSKSSKKKMVVAFGNEEKGLSQEILAESDSFINIPMDGFNESYNISVSCAIIMNQIISQAKKQNKLTYLNKKEMNDLRLEWYIKSIRNSSKVIKNLIKKK